MFRWLLPGAATVAVAFVVGPDRASQVHPQTAAGSVTGRITLTAGPSAPMAASAYGRRDVAPKPPQAFPPMRSVLVYVTGSRPEMPPEPTVARIVQRNEQFIPPVTAITTGSTVDFPNEDPFFHNVFSLSRTGPPFDLGRYRSGQSRSRRFSRPGIVKVFCDIHSHMNALIVVFDHPWFVIPADDGTFTIPGIPPGDRRIVAWHERIGERQETVRITAGRPSSVSFTLPVLEERR